MNLFDVYPLYNITPVKAVDCTITDENGVEYLDLYSGHGVISIGHTQPHYVAKVKEQLDNIGFYSNAIQNPLQVELAQKLGELSGYDDYALFLCSSGAEANENALKWCIKNQQAGGGQKFKTFCPRTPPPISRVKKFPFSAKVNFLP